jgi:hypothetical protein
MAMARMIGNVRIGTGSTGRRAVDGYESRGNGRTNWQVAGALCLSTPIWTQELFKALAANAVEIDGSELPRLREVAKRRRIFVSSGSRQQVSSCI